MMRVSEYQSCQFHYIVVISISHTISQVKNAYIASIGTLKVIKVYILFANIILENTNKSGRNDNKTEKTNNKGFCQDLL